jgi:hypothetical protein
MRACIDSTIRISKYSEMWTNNGNDLAPARENPHAKRFAN